MGSMNQGNWGALLKGGVQGAQDEQEMQGKYSANQIAGAQANEARRNDQKQTENFNAGSQRVNSLGGLDTGNPNAPMMTTQFQQSGGVFDPARNAIHSALAHIGQYYQNVFHGQPAQGQTNPSTPMQGRGPGPAAQQTTQPPGNAPMSRPQPTSSSPSAGGLPGASGPMPLPDREQTQGSSFAEGGAIPGRKLAGIRAKKAKPGNQAKPTAGDKQVAGQTQQPPQVPGGGMPPRNTEPGAGISNQDPVLADGGQPKKWVGKAIKHPGALHEDLGVPQGEKIPKSKIKAAEHSDNPKTAKRAQLADTMSKWKDGGMPKLPKLQPGAAPEPKPAPNAVEQDVSNDGMRHYLGKTIKRFADGGQDKPDVATPAGAKPASDEGFPGIIPAVAHGLNDIGNRVADSAESLYGLYGQAAQPVGRALFGTQNWDSANQPAPAQSPGKGTSPPQTSTASAAAGADRDEINSGHLTDPGSSTSPSRYVTDPKTGHLIDSGVQGPPGYVPPGPGHYAVDPKTMNYDETAALPGAEQRGANTAAVAATANAGSVPNGVAGPRARFLPGESGAPEAQGHQVAGAPQGPPAPATVDFSKVQADQSQVPTMTTQQWQQMKNGIVNVALGHGISGPQAEMMADEEVSKYQHGNFMQYMQQAAALDAAGNKQGAMTALKTAYQFFPTGHDMHFGLDPASGDIIGYGVNEQTGQPVANGAIHLNQQNIHGIMTHFADPNKFVDEGVRMQELANSTAHTGAQIGLENAQAKHAIAGAHYLEERNPTYLAGQEARANATAARGRLSQPANTEYLKVFNQYGIQDPEALAVAGELESKLNPTGNKAYQDQIAGEIAHMYGPSVDPAERAAWLKSKGIELPGQTTARNSPVPNRYDDPTATFNALNSQ